MEPLHITEFASERYFEKLRQLNERPDGLSSPSALFPSTADSSAAGPTFVLPPEPSPPLVEDESHVWSRSEPRKRSVGQDLAAARAPRRPAFALSFRSKRAPPRSSPAVFDPTEDFVSERLSSSKPRRNLGELLMELPRELQIQIIAPLPLHDILHLRLVSRAVYTLVAVHEAPIARHHLAHSIPQFALKLYPLEHQSEVSLHYICGLWHRLHIAAKLAIRISDQVTKEIFLRTTPARRKEFEPQEARMRQRLLPLIFALFHFFETYRELHVQHLMAGGTALSRWPYTINPIERRVMDMYDDRTLLEVHEVFPLIVSSFSRRLRPPSYAGRIEKTLKGYLRDRAPDEVCASVLTVGGLRQVQRVWETKGYNTRRAAVDHWYGNITAGSADLVTPRIVKKSLFPHFGRKKSNPSETKTRPRPNTASEQTNVDVDYSHVSNMAQNGVPCCREWFCAKPACGARHHRNMHSISSATSTLTAGPPMTPLAPEQLQQLMPDLPALHDIWQRTAEALILERKVVQRQQDIKRNTQVLLELIRDDGRDLNDDWVHNAALTRSTTTTSSTLGDFTEQVVSTSN